MKINLRKGYVTVSKQHHKRKYRDTDIDEWIPYLKVESQGVTVFLGENVICKQDDSMLTPIQMIENLYIINEDDIIATFTI
jgi:hypothetical protein